jgi:hypothetical protein
MTALAFESNFGPQHDLRAYPTTYYPRDIILCNTAPIQWPVAAQGAYNLQIHLFDKTCSPQGAAQRRGLRPVWRRCGPLVDHPQKARGHLRSGRGVPGKIWSPRAMIECVSKKITGEVFFREGLFSGWVVFFFLFRLFLLRWLIKHLSVRGTKKRGRASTPPPPPLPPAARPFFVCVFGRFSIKGTKKRGDFFLNGSARLKKNPGQTKYVRASFFFFLPLGIKGEGRS